MVSWSPLPKPYTGFSLELGYQNLWQTRGKRYPLKALIQYNRITMEPRPVYDLNHSYRWNYEFGPLVPEAFEVPPSPSPVTLLGYPLNSPLGIAAGPLLNSRWVALYARLGFDILTYKTVRSVERPSYPPPNLLPVSAPPNLEETSEDYGLYVSELPPRVEDLSLAISFGMPSADPDTWREDVRRAKKALLPGQILIVSVVGTPQEGGDLDQLAEDYARCAVWAVEAGADVVEVNLSCPNVVTGEGNLYRDPRASRAIVRRVRAHIGNVPLLCKIGHIASVEEALRLVDALVPSARGLVTLNTLARPILNRDGSPAFPGPHRQVCGVGGKAIQRATLQNVERIVKAWERLAVDIVLLVVGGVLSPQDVQTFLEAGADAVLCATGALFRPSLAAEWRREQAS